MTAGSDALSERRKELERRLAALSPAKRALLERPLATPDVTARAAGIPARAPGAAVPMSFAQELLWLLERANPGHGYNVPRSARLRGALDVNALQRALDALVARHEVLRSTFDLVDDEPRQIVHEPGSVPLARIDLGDRAPDEREGEAARLVAELARRPFDLARDLQLRATLLRLAEDDHVLLLESHHVASDAWSRNILLRELDALYEGFVVGTPAALSPLAIQYGDFALWQRETLAGERLQSLLDWWREQLAGAPAMLELPTDRPRPSVPSFEGATRSIVLPAELLERFRALARDRDATLFMALLTAFDVLLARYSGQEDIVVGSPIAARPHEETEGLIGYFANTLVLRTSLDGDPTFAELLDRVRRSCLGAYEHQEVPYEKLVLELQRGRTPLFQVMFTLQDAELRTVRLGALNAMPFGTGRGAAKFDLSLFMQERADGLRATLEYRTDLFDGVTIERMLSHLGVLLESAARDPEQRVSALPLLTESERRTLLHEWNDTAAERAEGATLHGLIAAQAARTPDAVAVECERVDGSIARLTFAELHERAASIARHLRRLGVGPDVGVAICAERSLELVVGMLGILEAGGYYVPLDPEYPAERLAFMLADARVPVLLTLERLREVLPELEGDYRPAVLALDAEWEHTASTSEHERRPTHEAGPDNLAYVIYTSGSTGRPKGVMIPHRAVVNYLEWMQREFPLTSRDAVLQKAPASFDACIWEFFLPLVTGARLVLARPGGHQDPTYLLAALERHDVTILQLVPSQLQMLMETPGAFAPSGLPRVRRLFLGGEALPGELLSRLCAACPSLPVTNLYGPTEATVYATHWSVAPGEWRGGAVSIGRPIANATVYVLDARRQLVPIGVPGELCIGGSGVARGYLERPELTAEKFIADPFSSTAGACLYRTGDRARWRADGTLEYLGRIDTQVKLRGFRIELGEIESALAGEPEVQSAAAIVREDRPGDQRLVAYCIAAPDAPGEKEALAAALRERLRRTLPDYMVPSAIVWMDAFPLNANGKLDRRALPAPADGARADAAFEAPRTALERTVGEIWEQVLQRRPIGVHDDFFDLGGHSLLALRVLGRIAERTGVRLPLRAMFEAPTLAALADRIALLSGNRERAGESAIPRRGAAEAPLSFGQELLWLVQRTSPESGAYNIAEQWRIEGALDVRALQRALDLLIVRHEILRTTIVAREGGPVQVAAHPRPLEIEHVDLRDRDVVGREGEARRLLRERARVPFDLARDLLLRAVLVRTGEDEHHLLLVLHHVAYDGWSRGVLLRELSHAYESFRAGAAPAFPDLPVRYADFAAWQRDRLRDGAMEAQLAYWRERLAGAATSLELPTDRPRPAAPSFVGEKRTTVFPAAVLEGVRRVAQAHDATLFHLLLAAFQTLLHRYAAQDDITVGTVVAGRGRAELEGVVGHFANTILLRGSFAGDPTFAEVLARVREAHLGASEHADIPFERLAMELQRGRAAGGAPLCQVMFALQNNAPAALRLGEAAVSAVGVDTGTAKFDLSLSMGEQTGGLRAAMQFRTDLFEPATIERMLGHFRTLLEGIVADPAARVSALPLLGPREREMMLVEWNRTARDYPRDATIHRLVAEHAARRPQAVALSHGTRSLTYEGLDARANQLARHLRGAGIAEGAVVGICLERSIEMVVSMLGVLKAGAAYLPLDPDYPRDRLAFMLDDARVAALFSVSDIAARLPTGGARLVLLDQHASLLDREERSAPEESTTAESCANVIYTSGSTGRPKGTLVPHRGVVRLVVNTSYMQLGPDDVMAQIASCSFDAATWEVWGALINGGRLAIVDREVTLSPNALAMELAQQQVTVLLLTTAVFNQLARFAPHGLRGVRWAFFGGEAADASAVRAVRQASKPEHLINAYGPTETSVIALTHEVGEIASDATSLPIGRPIANTTVYVLDAHMHPVPVGVPGELYVGGDGVALGYLRRPELTAERFLPDPFSNAPGARLYRTGDRVRWLADGTMEFLGRLDGQVKLRGFRVELGEIEAVMTEHPAVAAATVVARKDDGEMRIVGYYVPRGGEALAPATLRDFLRDRVPAYMVPAAVVPLPEIPVGPTGKVDRAALPVPEFADEERRAYVPPRTTIEHELVHLWERLLPMRPIGIDDDFFEIGGHSLLAAQMLHEIEQLRGRRLPFASLFVGATIERIAARLEAAVQEDAEPGAVVLQPEGKGSPIAFVHGDVRGGGWYCRRLAPLIDPDAPFIVLPTFQPKPGAPSTIEAMAAAHVAELRRIQPHGPYRIGGYCTGGFIAFEMARRLRELGETVSALVLVDTAAPNARFRAAAPLIALASRTGSDDTLARRGAILRRLRYYADRVRAVRRMSSAERRRWLSVNAKRRLGVGSAAPNGNGDAAHPLPSAEFLARPGTAVLRFQERAGAAYIPPRYDGEIDLIVATPDGPTDAPRSTRGWHRVTPSVRVHPVVASHLGLITNALPAFADTLRRCLEGRA